MRPSLRFLAVVVFGWAGVRAATLGVLPGAELFRIEKSEAKVPPIVPTEFPPIEPVAPAAVQAMPQPQYAPMAYAQQPIRPVMVPVYYAAPVSPPVRAVPASNPLQTPQPPLMLSSGRDLDGWSLSRFAGVSMPVRSSTPVPRDEPPPPAPVPPLRPGLDRWQLSSWALLRNQQTGIAGSSSLATGGQLGASQAGARLIYNLTRQLAFTARTSSEVGRRGGEVAAGVRVQPIPRIPVWLTAERRQAIGRYGGGRNDFALFAEGGLYQMPMPWRFVLDGYVQGGVVGIKTRDLFVDGGLAFTRPVASRFSAGFGVWGGAQPGLYRLDAGPRLTMRVRGNVKVHFDWRQRLVGNARPGSGPALTLSGDF